jgi:hypothetical protein
MRWPIPVQAESGIRVGVATSFVPGLESVEMLEQCVRGLVALDYPHDTWVLDEGDDPTVRALCRRLGANHFSRRGRPEYQQAEGRYARQSKHGNYNAWLDQEGFHRYDVVVTFDPDHVPETRYLSRVLGHFRDETTGYVQPPQVYYNQNANLIARGAAEETYAYYSSHLMASYGLGHTVVIGSHSAHRVKALKEVGGFPAHDAEDLYLTMLYRANGWHGVYVPEVLAMGTAPVTWAGYLRQQVRWSRAVLDLKRNVYPRLADKLSRSERVLNLFHGMYYFRPLLLVALYTMLLGMIVIGATPSFLEPGPLLALVALISLLVACDRFRQRFFLDPPRERGFHWRAALLQAAKAPHVSAALIDVILNRRVEYVTTPKVHPAVRTGSVLAAPHIAFATLLAGALGLSYYLRDHVPPVLLALAVLVMAVSLGLAWTELVPNPPPFDPSLLAERRFQMTDVLQFSAWPVPAPIETAPETSSPTER